VEEEYQVMSFGTKKIKEKRNGGKCKRKRKKGERKEKGKYKGKINSK
jgi:hypothetical protein